MSGENRINKNRFIIIIVVLLVYSIYNATYYETLDIDAPQYKGTIHVAFALTRDNDDRYINATKTVIKSIVLLSNAEVIFHIFTYDKSVVKILEISTSTWHGSYNERISFLHHRLSCVDWEPNIKDYKLFTDYPPKLCMLLELPHLEIDKLIFLDADTLVVSDIQEIWNHFETFHDKISISMAYGGLKYNKLKKDDRIPRFGKYGLNSGVILIDLDKYRKQKIPQKLVRHFNIYARSLRNYRGDQAYLNSVLVKHRNYFTSMSCSFNFRMSQARCKNASSLRAAWQTCQDAWKEGVFIIHDPHQAGSIYKIPVFKIIRSIIHNFPMNETLQRAATAKKYIIHTARFCQDRQEHGLVAPFLRAMKNNRKAAFTIEHELTNIIDVM